MFDEPPLRRRAARTDHQRAAPAAAARRSARPGPAASCWTGSSQFALRQARRATCRRRPCRLQGPVQLRRRDHAVPARAGALRRLPSTGDDGAFERIVRALGPAAGAGAGASSPCWRWPAARWRCGWSRARPWTRSSAAGRTRYQATETYRERFGDHSVLVLVRGELPRARADLQPRPAGRPRGLPVGQQAGGPGGARRRAARRATGWRETKPVQVVYGPGTFINAAGRRDQRPDPGPDAHEGGRGGAGGARRAAGRARARASRRPSRSGSASRRASSSTRSSCATCCRSTCATGSASTELPSIDDPDFVSALVFDASRGAETPKARFAYLFPSRESALIQVRLKPDLTDDAARAGGRARARGGADARVAADRRGGLHGDRRAGGGRRPHRRAGRLDAAPAGRRPRADGARARARLPQPAAAAAAGDRAGRRGDHVRGDGAARRCR